MKKSGSITVFTSFFLAVFLLVFQVLLQSVQIGGGRRTRTETGVEGRAVFGYLPGSDVGTARKGIIVFMVDGSYGTGVWKPECMYTNGKKMYGRELSSGWSNIRCSWGKSVEMFVCLGGNYCIHTDVR